MVTVLLVSLLATAPVCQAAPEGVSYSNVTPLSLSNKTGSLDICLAPPKPGDPDYFLAKADKKKDPDPDQTVGCVIARYPSGPKKGRIVRSERAKSDFKLRFACPSNGLRHGPCPGYVIDHIIPLCAGGCDTAANMQWQDTKGSQQKDKLEVAMCHAGLVFKKKEPKKVASSRE